MTTARKRVLAATAELLIGGRREGSAVLVDDKGHLLTAAHAVRRAVEDPTLAVTVVFPNRSDELSVDVVPLSESHGVDAAILRLADEAAAHGILENDDPTWHRG